MIKHSQFTLKITNLQYLYNISKKGYLWSSFFTYRLASKFVQDCIIVFDGKTQTSSKYPQNRKLVIFFSISSEKEIDSLISSVENKKICIQKVTGDKFL